MGETVTGSGVEISEEHMRRWDEPGDMPSPEASRDVRLLEAIAARDQHALEAFYSQYGALVYSLLVRMLGNEMEAQELTQDTFLRVWRTAERYDPARSGPGGWVIMIARGLGLDRLRARVRASRRQAAYESELADLEVEVKSARSPERDELAAACAAALNRLPEPQGQALQLAFLRGWTHEEIARATNEPLGTVKARIRRGLLALRAILRDYHA